MTDTPPPPRSPAAVDVALADAIAWARKLAELTDLQNAARIVLPRLQPEAIKNLRALADAAEAAQCAFNAGAEAMRAQASKRCEDEGRLYWQAGDTACSGACVTLAHAINALPAHPRRPMPSPTQPGVGDGEIDGFRGAYRSNKAKGCPFCGSTPIIVPWHGGGPRKRNVMCRSDECGPSPNVCGSTEAVAIAMWNKRAPR